MADYSNRSDLRNAATKQARFTGQTYGQASQQAASQQAVPPGTSPATLQGQQAAAQQGPPRPRPGAQPLGRPSERPTEPITAGAPFGPGPNAVEAGIAPRFIQTDQVEEQLVALYQAYPNDGLLRLINRIRDRRQ